MWIKGKSEFLYYFHNFSIKLKVRRKEKKCQVLLSQSHHKFQEGRSQKVPM